MSDCGVLGQLDQRPSGVARWVVVTGTENGWVRFRQADLEVAMQHLKKSRLPAGDMGLEQWWG